MLAWQRLDEFRVCQEVAQLRVSSALRNSEVDGIVDELSLSEIEIREKWQEARLRGSREGTWMHAQLEYLLNGGSLPLKTPEVALLAKFLESQRNVVAFRTEWKVYADKEDVAGSISTTWPYRLRGRAGGRDQGCRRLEATRNLEDECNSFSRSMRCPLDDVPDCVLWHYRLQLNVYRYILQHYYSETVSGMYVVGTNPDNPQEPFVDVVPVMDAETAALMETCG